MSMTNPPGGVGTLHILVAVGVKDRIYEWTGKAWSTPGTQYSTKPAYMSALGWRYGRPVQPQDQSK